MVVTGTLSSQATKADSTSVVSVPVAPVLTPACAAGSQLPDLAWTTSDPWSNFDAYLVEVTSDPTFQTGVHTREAFGTSVTLPTEFLSPGVTYFWRVTAHNAAGQATSAVGTFATAP